MWRTYRSHPRFAFAAWIGLGYFACSGAAVGLTRLGGGVACIWVASAVLLAGLAASRRSQWATIILACMIGGCVSSAIWGVGLRMGPAVTVVNIGEALLAATLTVRWSINRSGLDSAQSLALFLLAAGIIAPGVSAFPGAAVVSASSNTAFWPNCAHWFIAHGLGAITFTPVFALVATGDMRKWVARADRRRIVETLLLLLLVGLTAFGVFAQSDLPLLFVPALPLMLVTFRAGRIGAAAGVVIIALIGTALTLRGLGPVNLVHATPAERILFFQVYLGATVMTILPIAADLKRRSKLFERLHDSEARFRLLTESSTDIVMNLTVDGAIRYVSPSIATLGGYDPETLVGRVAASLVHRDDRESVSDVHRRAIAAPGETFIVEYRAITRAADQRWFETHTRAVLDDHGKVNGVVSAIRETTHRRRAEAELRQAAHTDPLTGLCNRRSFDSELAQRLDPAGSGGGCVAVFDLDHFKRTNDTFGHAMGDEVLKAFARTTEAQVRGDDMVARIGGEEFGIIFPNMPIAIAEKVCERIRLAVAALDLRANEWPVRATVSIGIASFEAGATIETVMRRADTALYRAKDEGRNRLALAA